MMPQIPLPTPCPTVPSTSAGPGGPSASAYTGGIGLLGNLSLLPLFAAVVAMENLFSPTCSVGETELHLPSGKYTPRPSGQTGVGETRHSLHIDAITSVAGVSL